jgi:dipeptidyl-peptidase-4
MDGDICTDTTRRYDIAVDLDKRHGQHLSQLASGSYIAVMSCHCLMCDTTIQGELVVRLTKGPWHVDGFIGYDASQSTVFLTGCGREADEDPFYKHVYSVGLSGGEVVLLDPGNTNHEGTQQNTCLGLNSLGFRRVFLAGVSLCESGAYFVETSTRVDTVPISTLRNAATGIAVMQLEESDVSQLLGARPAFVLPQDHSANLRLCDT